MGELLDTGLHALIAPREGGSGVGLVLGALAAAAGLAVLGVTAREKAAAALADVPMATMPVRDCLVGRALGLAGIEHLNHIWEQELNFGAPGGRSLKDYAADVGWTTEPPKDEVERAVLLDALLEAGHPVGVSAQAFATDTPLLRVAPDGQQAALYHYNQLPELMALKPQERVDVVAARARCRPIAFSVSGLDPRHAGVAARMPRIECSPSRYWVQPTPSLNVLGALASARAQEGSYWTWLTNEEDE